MPIRALEYPGFTPYEVHGPTHPEAVLLFAPSRNSDAIERAREYARSATAADSSLAVAVPTAPLDGSEFSDQTSRLAAQLHDLHSQPGRSVLVGLGQVPPAEAAMLSEALTGVQGVYLLGDEDSESRSRYLTALPSFVDFADGLSPADPPLARRLGAARDLGFRQRARQGLVDDLTIELKGGRNIAKPEELPVDVVWADRDPAGANWPDDIAAQNPKAVVKLATAMSSLPIMGLVTNGRKVTGLLGSGVPANSELVRLHLGRQFVEWRTGVDAFAVTSRAQRAEAKLDAAVLRPLGPLKGWEAEFATALDPLLPRDSDQSLFIDAAEGFETQASLVAGALLERRPDLKNRIGLAIEPQRFLTSVNVKLLHRLRELCTDNGVRLLYQRDREIGLDEARQLIAGDASQWADYSSRTPVKAALAIGGGSRRASRNPRR